jgi:hypothetical protein
VIAEPEGEEPAPVLGEDAVGELEPPLVLPVLPVSVVVALPVLSLDAVGP